MELMVGSAGVALPATVDEPAREPRGGVVVLHAAEAAHRSYFLYTHLSQVLTAQGIAVLRFDRVEAGRQPDHAVAAIRALREQTGDVPMGLWGIGAGAMTAVKATAEYPAEVDFLIAVSVPGQRDWLTVPVLEFHSGNVARGSLAGNADSLAVALPGCEYLPTNGDGAISPIYTEAMVSWLRRLLGPEK